MYESDEKEEACLTERCAVPRVFSENSDLLSVVIENWMGIISWLFRGGGSRLLITTRQQSSKDTVRGGGRQDTKGKTNRSIGGEEQGRWVGWSGYKPCSSLLQSRLEVESVRGSRRKASG